MFKFSTASLFKYIISTFILVCIGHIIAVNNMNDLTTATGIGLIFKKLFYFGDEKTFSALFTSFLFVVLAVFFKHIGTLETKLQKHWNCLSYIAFFLAADEWFAIHDAVLNIYGMGLFNIPVWVWVYGSLTLILLITYIPFLKKIPATLMKYLILSGATYVSGSVIMEVMTYSYTDIHSLTQNIGWFIEDSLEMIGIIIMIKGASIWLDTQRNYEITLNKVIVFVVIPVGVIDLVVSYFVI